jgi:hypothetical protein
MAKRKAKSKSSRVSKSKGWGGFTPFQILVIGAVIIVFIIFFIV